MATIRNCVLCYNEFKKESGFCYPSKFRELCCNYLHSSLTQETLSNPFNSDDVSFCPKCFHSVEELAELNGTFEFYRKRISEFVFLLSLEILHRRGKLPNNKTRPNYTDSERQLIEVDVSALPNCNFRKTYSDEAPIFMGNVSSADNYHNFDNPESVNEELNDPLFISSPVVNVNALATFETVKLENGGFDLVGGETPEETFDAEDICMNSNFKRYDNKVSVAENRSQEFPRSHYNSNVNSNPGTSSTSQRGQELPEVQGADHSEGVLTRKFKPKNKRLERIHQCDICQKRFKHSHHLLSHKIRHRDRKEKAFKCTFCETGFFHHSALIKHLRSHSGERPYTCEFCGKGFKNQHYLKIHSNSHSSDNSEKPHCEVCGKGFVSQHYLTIHSRLHTGEKPYQCQGCGKGFAQKGNMLRHKCQTGETSQNQ